MRHSGTLSLCGTAPAFEFFSRVPSAIVAKGIGYGFCPGKYIPPVFFMNASFRRPDPVWPLLLNVPYLCIGV